MGKKSTSFRDLHVSGQPFVLANVWDMGSARMFGALGVRALATSSSAHAFTLGVPDMGQVSRADALAHVRDIVRATPLPVSADLENGYGDDPATVGETVRLAAACGLCGCCIEDTALPGSDPLDFSLAVERIEAAAAAARAETEDFVLPARADGLMLGTYGLDEAIRRIRAFEKAGADVLYVPEPADMDALGQICRAVSRPVNALVAGDFCRFGLQDFARLGVARISLGSSLARSVHRVILDCASSMLEEGDFSGLLTTVGQDVINPMLEKYR